MARGTCLLHGSSRNVDCFPWRDASEDRLKGRLLTTSIDTEIPVGVDARGVPPQDRFVTMLRGYALRGLVRMYDRNARLVVFRLKRSSDGIIAEGLSRRYTAIAVIGLAAEGPPAAVRVLGGDSLHTVCARLLEDIGDATNLGDVALTLWAAKAAGYQARESALRRLIALDPVTRPHHTVELAWALAALSIDVDAPVDTLRRRLAVRLMSACGDRSALFPHVVGRNGSGLRAHVACFADQIYPIHALATYAMVSGRQDAIDTALRCAARICRLKGSSGQWWWHYDCRTGEVVERYPVYAIHQDAMAPMALFAVHAAAGVDFSGDIALGLDWLKRPPELRGGTLVDGNADLIWRKVARREPWKLARSIQAAVSRVHPRLRAPALDLLLRPTKVDHEDRPYHPGWLLYAWPPQRVHQWETRKAP